MSERAVKKDLAVIDDEHAMTELLDVLHVMASQQRHDPMLLVVDAQKFPHTLLADDIESDCWFV